MRISLFAFTLALMEFSHAASLVQVMDNHQVLTQQQTSEDYRDLAFEAAQTTTEGPPDEFMKAIATASHKLQKVVKLGKEKLSAESTSGVTAIANIAKVALAGFGNDAIGTVFPEIKLETFTAGEYLSAADATASVDATRYRSSVMMSYLNSISQQTAIEGLLKTIAQLPGIVHVTSILGKLAKFFSARPDNDACRKKMSLRKPWEGTRIPEAGECSDGRKLHLVFLCLEENQCEGVRVDGKAVAMISCGPFCATAEYCNFLSEGILADLVGLAITIGTTLGTGGFAAASPMVILSFIDSIITILDKLNHPSCSTIQTGRPRVNAPIIGMAVGPSPTLTAATSVPHTASTFSRIISM